MLNVTNLIGFGGTQRLAPVALSYLGRQASEVDSAIYTFAGYSLGDPRHDREIIVVAEHESPCSGCGTFSRFPTGVTVAGIAATQHKVSWHANNNANGSVGIFSAHIPAGTTGDIVVTYNGAVARAAVYAYRMVNHRDRLPVFKGEVKIVDTMNLVVSPIPHGSCIVAGAVSSDGNAFTWTNINEDDDASFVGRITAASISGLSEAPSRTITAATPTSGNTRLMAAASWR